MALILFIDTSADEALVGLERDGVILAVEKNKQQKFASFLVYVKPENYNRLKSFSNSVLLWVCSSICFFMTAGVPATITPAGTS